MILWTIQNEEVLEVLQREGTYHANEDYLLCRDMPSITFVYDWLSEGIIDKVGIPPEGVKYPIWAWHSWEGERRRRDLRRTGYGKKGTRMVQMEIEVPDEDVVLSDFDLWCAVMNYCNLNLQSEEEWDRFDEKLFKYGYSLCENLFLDREGKPLILNNPELEALKDEVIQSWNRIYDIDAPYIVFFEGSLKSIQANFWELKIEQVRKVWYFQCR